MRARTLVLLLVAMSCGCRGQDSAPPPAPPAAATTSSVTASAAPLGMRLGWVTGSCLAIANQSLPPGSPITVASLDDKAAIVDGRVGGVTASEAICPALLPDRRVHNASKWSFYELKLSAPVDLGIGVIGEARAVTGGLDLNGNGAPEKFTQCASSEGVWFRVWSGPAYQGTPLWSGYYYLGYDTEVTCPS
jgi:hypothetical protein